MSMRKFQDKVKESTVEHKKIYSDTELRTMNEVINKDFNGLRSKKDLEKFYAHEGAGSVRNGIFSVVPGQFQIIDDKLDQWSRWLAKTYPRDRLLDYEKMAEQSGEVAREKKEEKVIKKFLRRSALIAYKEKHGVEYQVPEGVRIEEDVENLTEAVTNF